MGEIHQLCVLPSLLTAEREDKAGSQGSWTRRCKESEEVWDGGVGGGEGEAAGKVP